jgi:hypothetical protein
VPLVHHELCFGCGRTNLFGLLAELERPDPNTVAGRCFIKQDHQGPDPGQAHPGIVAAALAEAISFAGGPELRLERLTIEFIAAAPVGTFIEVEASAGPEAGHATARATADGRSVARARGVYAPD